MQPHHDAATNRVVGAVRRDGQDVNTEMVRVCMAGVYGLNVTDPSLYQKQKEVQSQHWRP